MVTVDSPGEETCGNARYPSLATLANDLLQNGSIAARDLSYAGRNALHYRVTRNEGDPSKASQYHAYNSGTL